MRMSRGRVVLAALTLGLLVGTETDPRVRGPAPDEGRGQLKIVVNVAARRLHVYENGERMRSYTVAVGKPGHRTPPGSYRISRVVWNPWWHPPKSKWARGRKVTPPGPSNPMGRAKLYFREMYYIHGTSERSSLGSAVSHGCIRMANKDVIQLARLVHDHGSPNIAESELQYLVGHPKNTRTIWLKNPVPLEVVSRSAEVHDGRLEIYAANGSFSEGEIRRHALEALEEAGFDLEDLDRERFEDLVKIGRRRMMSVALDRLVAPTATAAEAAGTS